MGEIHELSVLPLSLVWFAGATPDFWAFIHGFFFFPQQERQLHRITLMLTIHDLNSRAIGSLITPITLTDSLRSCE